MSTQTNVMLSQTTNLASILQLGLGKGDDGLLEDADFEQPGLVQSVVTNYLVDHAQLTRQVLLAQKVLQSRTTTMVT